jgi:hypothetical protein
MILYRAYTDSAINKQQAGPLLCLVDVVDSWCKMEPKFSRIRESVEVLHLLERLSWLGALLRPVHEATKAERDRSSIPGCDTA